MARRKKKKKNTRVSSASESRNPSDTAPPKPLKTEMATAKHVIARSIDPIAKALAEMTTHPDHGLDRECPICLQRLHPLDIVKAKWLLCCGGRCCTKCVEEKESYVIRSIAKKKGRCNAADVQLICHCVLCRQIVPPKEQEEALLLEHAAKGRPWTQWTLGCCHLFGCKTIARRSVYLGHELLMRAAKQGFSLALGTLGYCYYAGTKGFEKSLENAIFCYENAVDQGFEPARAYLGQIYIELGNHIKAAKNLQDFFSGTAGICFLDPREKDALLTIDFDDEEEEVVEV